MLPSTPTVLNATTMTSFFSTDPDRLYLAVGGSASRYPDARRDFQLSSMDDDDEGKRELWDTKYRQGLPSLVNPDPFFLVAYSTFVVEQFPNGGVGLDLAGGQGRHALWLAARNWQVNVVEISDVALVKLRAAAAKVNLKLDLFEGDAAKYNIKQKQFDVILLFYHFDQTLFPKIVSGLKPGGLLVCKMAVRWNADAGPTNAVFVYQLENRLNSAR